MRYRLRKEEKEIIKNKYKSHPLYQLLNDACKQFEREMPKLRFSPEEVFVLVVAYLEEMASDPEEARSFCERLWVDVFCGIRDAGEEVDDKELELATCVVLISLYVCFELLEASHYKTLMMEVGMQMHDNYLLYWQQTQNRFMTPAYRRGTERLKEWLAVFVASDEFLTDEFERVFNGEEEAVVEVLEMSFYRIAEKHKANFAKIISAAYELHMFEDETGKVASNKQNLMNALGAFFGVDYKNLSQLLYSAKQNGNYTEIFDKLKEKAEKYDQK